MDLIKEQGRNRIVSVHRFTVKGKLVIVKIYMANTEAVVKVLQMRIKIVG